MDQKIHNRENRWSNWLCFFLGRMCSSGGDFTGHDTSRQATQGSGGINLHARGF